MKKIIDWLRSYSLITSFLVTILVLVCTSVLLATKPAAVDHKPHSVVVMDKRLVDKHLVFLGCTLDAKCHIIKAESLTQWKDTEIGSVIVGEEL